MILRRQIQVGDVVRLRSGGPEMTVLGIALGLAGYVRIGWFAPSGSILQEAEVDRASLELLAGSLADDTPSRSRPTQRFPPVAPPSRLAHRCRCRWHAPELHAAGVGCVACREKGDTCGCKRSYEDILVDLGERPARGGFGAPGLPSDPSSAPATVTRPLPEEYGEPQPSDVDAVLEDTAGAADVSSGVIVEVEEPSSPPKDGEEIPF